MKIDRSFVLFAGLALLACALTLLVLGLAKPIFQATNPGVAESLGRGRAESTAELIKTAPPPEGRLPTRQEINQLADDLIARVDSLKARAEQASQAELARLAQKQAAQQAKVEQTKQELRQAFQGFVDSVQADIHNKERQAKAARAQANSHHARVIQHLKQMIEYQRTVVQQ